MSLSTHFRKVVLAGLSSIALLSGCSPGILQKTDTVDYGTVERIENCQTHKYGLACDVKTDKLVLNKVDITRFPGHYLTAGDKIGYEEANFEHLWQASYVKNGVKNLTGECRNQFCIQNASPAPHLK